MRGIRLRVFYLGIGFLFHFLATPSPSLGNDRKAKRLEAMTRLRSFLLALYRAELGSLEEAHELFSPGPSASMLELAKPLPLDKREAFLRLIATKPPFFQGAREPAASLAWGKLRHELWTVFEVRHRPAMPVELAAGKSLYNEHCLGCHGDGLTKGPLASRLRFAPRAWSEGIYQKSLAPAMTHLFIADGIKTRGMPAFGGKLPLDAIWAVSHYVATLVTSLPDRATGDPLADRLLPITLERLCESSNDELDAWIKERVSLGARFPFRAVNLRHGPIHKVGR